jgi:hypothetical protein
LSGEIADEGCVVIAKDREGVDHRLLVVARGDELTSQLRQLRVFSSA